MNDLKGKENVLRKGKKLYLEGTSSSEEAAKGEKNASSSKMVKRGRKRRAAIFGLATRLKATADLTMIR